MENIQRGNPWKKKFSFLFNTVFYSGIPKETIRMPFRGLTMLKSRKSVIKGGLCYRFAMVQRAADIFRIMDVNNDGRVTRAEFVRTCLNDQKLLNLLTPNTE